jgi:hypothetical protein
MKHHALLHRLSISLLLALLVTASSSSLTPQASAQGKSLYDRLGGYNAIAAVTDDFIGRLVGDKRFARFFGGHSKDSLKRIRQHIVDRSHGRPLRLYGTHHESLARGSEHLRRGLAGSR